MAFVPGFKHDVFISYARMDDIPTADTSGWVATFVSHLKRRLAARLGQTDAYSIWMDNRLDGNDPFSDALIKNISEAATMLIVLSPGYLQSEWCRRETNEFLAAVRLSKVSDRRIFVVEIERTDRKTWPHELQDLLAYRFWTEDANGFVRISERPTGDAQYYYKLVDEIAEDLATVLKHLRNNTPESVIVNRPKASEEPPAKTKSRFTPPPLSSDLEIRRETGDYDVFLCHNSEDKASVEEVAKLLLREGILPWLDEWDLRPGLPWQESLEAQIEQIKSAAVFVGASGFGPWQNLELAALLREFAKRRCPVIPVILDTCVKVPQLPAFLRALHAVDFRAQNPDPLGQLLWGITGKRPTRQRPAK